MSPNLLEQNFEYARPNEKWTSDITYLMTSEGWLYLTVMIELHSCTVIGWSMSTRMTAGLVCDALERALWRRNYLQGLMRSQRPWQPVLLSSLPLSDPETCLTPEHEPQRQLLGQRLSRELLPFKEGRGDAVRAAQDPDRTLTASISSTLKLITTARDGTVP